MKQVKVRVKEAIKLLDDGRGRVNYIGSLFCDVMNRISCEIRLIKDGKDVNAKSVMAIASLGIKNGEMISFKVDGYKEENVVQNIITVLEKLRVIERMDKVEAEYQFDAGGIANFMDKETYDLLLADPKETYYYPEFIEEFSRVTLWKNGDQILYVFPK